MSSNFRKVVFFLLLIAVSCIAYQFMIKPVNKDLAEKRARVEDKMLRLNEFEKANRAAKNLSAQLEDLHQAIEFFESKLPPTSEIYNVLEQLTVIAQKQGLKPKTIKTLNKKDNSGYVEQPLKMQLVGNFNAFYSFMLEIEKLPRIMKIRELKIKKTGDKGFEGEVETDFVVSIFFQNKTV